jgi:hypothetical protein
VEFVNRKSCEENYTATKDTITASMMCAAGRSKGGITDSCQGDSGGDAKPERSRLPHFKFSNCLAFAYLHCLHSDPKLKKPEATTSVSLDFRTTTFFEKEFYRKSIQILW